MKRTSFVFGCFLAASLGSAQTWSTYFRTANVSSPFPAFRVPAPTGVPGTSLVRLNNDDELIGALGDTSGRPQLWRGNVGSGGVVFTEPFTPTNFSGTLGFNDSERVIFAYISGGPLGLYQMDSANAVSLLTNSVPAGNTSWSSPAVNHAGQSVWRQTVGGVNRWAVLDPSGTSATTVAVSGQTLTVNGSPSAISFLYTPWLDASSRVYGAVGVGTASTVGEIRRFSLDGSSSVVVGLNNALLYGFAFDSISNLMHVNAAGQVAFMARTAGIWGLYVGGVGQVPRKVVDAIAGTLVGSSDFINFPPHINDNGVVAFRGRDGRAGFGNRRSLYVGTPNGFVKQILSEGDVLFDASASANVRIGWDTTFTSSPFYANAVINNSNRVAMLSTITDPVATNVRWGASGLVSSAAVTTLSGTVTFNSWIGGNRNYTLEVRDATTSALLGSGAFTSNGASGNFTLNFADVSATSAKLTVKPLGALRTSVTVTLGAVTSGLNLVIRPADVDGSGEVDAADIDAIISAFGSSTFPADVDGSGEVDAADIDIAIASFGNVDQ